MKRLLFTNRTGRCSGEGETKSRAGCVDRCCGGDKLKAQEDSRLTWRRYWNHDSSG